MSEWLAQILPQPSEYKPRASATCPVQREMRLQSALNTPTEGLIGLLCKDGIYSTVQEIAC
jgi:hypothetical protein